LPTFPSKKSVITLNTAATVCLGSAARYDRSRLEKMQEEFGLHDLAIEDARHGHQRPKVEEYGDTLFVVMHIVEAEHSN